MIQPCVCLICQEDMELERQIQELQDKRRILRMRINPNHDPFDFKFPPEIASLIFSLAMGKEDYEPDEESALCKLPTQFLLGSVNRKWRELARSTPQLWSTVSFTLVGEKMNAPPPLKFINDWLQLSGNLPLTLWITGYSDDPHHWEICPPVVNALNQHSERWHKLFFDLDKRYLPHFHGTASPTNLYNLEIINNNQHQYELPPTYFSMASRPSPACLTLDTLLLSNIDIVWNNVKCLTLRFTTSQECLEALKLAPLMESYTLSYLDSPIIDDEDEFWAPPPSSRPIFRHEHLRKLLISDTESDSLIGFIDMVEFPSLEELSYTLDDNVDITKTGLIPLLERSGSRLKRLMVLGRSYCTA